MLNDIFYGLGDLFYATFSILPPLNNGPNMFFLVTGMVAALYWTLQLVKDSKEGNA